MDGTDHRFVCMYDRFPPAGLTHFLFSNSEQQSISKNLKSCLSKTEKP